MAAKKKNEDTLMMLANVLLIIGGLNWGLIGLFDLDLVQAIFGGSPMLVRIVYILVGLSAVYVFLMWGGMTGKKR